MHELSLSSAILDTVLRHANGRRVTAVQMRIGAMRQVVPDSLDFYFGVVNRDTPASGARLEQELIEARLQCRDCGHNWTLAYPDFRCPGCGSGGIEILSGTEFEVDSILVEETEAEREEGECIAPR